MIKKFTLLAIISAVFFTMSNAQIIFTEDFSSGLGSFTVINNGSSNGFEHATSDGINNSGCVKLKYSTATHDDWLITPKLTIVDGSYIQFQAKKLISTEIDDFDVCVSIAGNSAADFTTKIAENVKPEKSFKKYRYDLSAFAGKKIYVAIHVTTTKEGPVYFDNFIFGNLFDNDLKINDISPKYVETGTSEKPKITVYNNGLTIATDFKVELSESTTSYNETINISSASFKPKSDTVIEFPNWTPSSNGYKEFKAIVTLTGDQDKNNDTIIDNIYSGPYFDSYTSLIDQGLYATFNTGTGTFKNGLQVLKSPFPISEDFDGNKIYRLLENNYFGTVNPIGEYSQIATLSGVTGTPGCFAYNFVDKKMYVSLNDNDKHFQLCSLNLSTGQLSKIGEKQDTVVFAGMDFANDGIIYAHATNDTLYKIDPTNGNISKVGHIGYSNTYSIIGMSYNTQNNTMYAFVTLFDGVTMPKMIYGSYNLKTGRFTKITKLGYQPLTMVFTKTPTGPLVETTTPKIAEKDVATDAQVTVTFNKDITATDLTKINIKPDPGNVSATINGKIIEITHDNFKNKKEYTVNIPKGTIKDFNAEINWKFTTFGNSSNLQKNINNPVKVYPNPTTGVIHITSEKNANIKIYDLQGKVISDFPIKANETIHYEDAKHGTFFMKIENKDFIKTYKLIIE